MVTPMIILSFTFQPMGCLAVVGHEFSHGVIRYTLGTTPDWEIGDEVGSVTSLLNPHVSWNYQPVFYLEPGYYYMGVNGDVEAHINKGVQNKWFHLLSEGGSQQGQVVNGIGIDKAALIAYVGLTNNLTSGSHYFDSRAATISAAEALYGVCSNEAIQTANAWRAVRVGNASTCTGIWRNDLEAFPVTIFPNPANDQVRIISSMEVIDLIAIFDLQGKEILSKSNVYSKDLLIDISKLGSGVYFLKIRGGKKIKNHKDIAKLDKNN